jgi:NTP pyrophosphatase (non-canonical NTP hydrolase)
VAAALGTTSDHFWGIDEAAPPDSPTDPVEIASHAACIGCIHLNRFRKSALLCEVSNKLIIPQFPPTRCDDREETVMEPIRRTQILQSAIDTYGVDPQMDMMVEECSELIQAICKYRRGRDDATANICEEIADVQIVLDQLKLVFDRHAISQAEEYKLTRLCDRVKRAKEAHA